MSAPTLTMKRFLQTIAISLGMMAAQGPAYAADLVVDNSDPGFSVVGDWPVSTAVAGYHGANYQTHIANGPVPGALTVDNTDAGFSVTGDWPVSTAVAGHLGANYRTHVANGPRPGSFVIDNTSGTALGTWPVSTAVAGYQGGNYQTHAAGNGTDSFTWPLAGNGHYRVYARWTSHANRAGNARYTIRHTGGDTPVSVSQEQNGGSWQLLGTFELDANSQIVLTDDANGYVIADAVMAEPVAATPNTATWELPVSLAGNYRLNARWSAHPNRASNARYRITHNGGDTEVSVDQQQNGGRWQSLGTYALAPGQARVALTDDADGYVVADAVMAVPDTAPAANRATWTPTLAQAGRYDMYARWTAHPNRATQARYTVRHVGGETAVVVNQQQGSGQWQLLGRFDLAPGQGAITLTDDADGYVIADAVRLTSVGPVQASLYFIHPDHLGTPRLVTDEQNTVVWRHLPTTEPFGNTPPEEDLQGTGQRFEMPLAFPGQYRDKESGLSYNYFRDYSPGEGRYLSPDPIGLAGGINPYVYVGNAPTMFTDPLGLCAPGDVMCKIANRNAGLPNPSSPPTPTNVQLCRNATVSVGAGLSCTVSWNSCTGTSYVGVGYGFGASASYTYGPNVSVASPSGLGARISGALGTGFVGANGSATFTPTGVAANGGVGVGTIGASVNATAGWKF